MLRTLSAKKYRESSDRAGSTTVMVSMMLFVFIITAALTIDVAYMQLIRTELRSSTDAAAKAAAEALSRTESEDDARQAALDYAALNLVAGAPLVLGNEDIQFGRVTPNESGGWDFDAAGTPANSVRVQGRLADDAATKPIKLFFAPALGHDDYSTASSAVASQQDVEVVLCLDRSGSMLFDMSGVAWVYPTPNPNLSSWTYWGTTWRYHLSPPEPTESRWAILANAVDLFLDEVGSLDPQPRTSLVTWGSDYQMPISPYTDYVSAQIDYALPSRLSHNWSQNKSGIQSAISNLGSIPMMGGTNLSAGLDEAVSVLSGAGASSLSNKVVILLTDGEWNYGRDPVQAAQDAADAGVTVHTITMLSNDASTMRQIANATGGKYYDARNQTQLRTAFAELARSLPVVLTE